MDGYKKDVELSVESGQDRGPASQCRRASKSVLQGLVGFLGVSGGRKRDRLEEVRAAMIAALGGRGSSALARRLRYALDIESLWYLRADLHLALARLDTEHKARECLESITAMFVGEIPAAFASRFVGMQPRVSVTAR